MGSNGVTWAGEGNQDVTNRDYDTTMGAGGGSASGKGVTFVNDASGDIVDRMLGTNKIGNTDPVNHKMSGEGFTPINDNSSFQTKLS